MICTQIKDKNANWWAYIKVDNKYTFYASCVNGSCRKRDEDKRYQYIDFDDITLARIALNKDYQINILNDEEITKQIKES